MSEVHSTLLLSNVRLGRFVHLVTPRQGRARPNGDIPEPKYEVEVILPPNHPQLPEILKRQREAVEKKFGARYEQVLVGLAAKDKVLLHKGDATRIGKPEYAGMLYFSAKNKAQPTIIGQEGMEVLANRDTPRQLLPGHATWPYPGCKANVELDIWCVENDGGLVGAQLLTVQFAGHLPRLGMQQYGSAKAFAPVADIDEPAPAAAETVGGLI